MSSTLMDNTSSLSNYSISWKLKEYIVQKFVTPFQVGGDDSSEEIVIKAFAIDQDEHEKIY